MRFEKAFNTLQENTERVWELFSLYDNTVLNRPQAPGKWSALQHMAHINKSERSFVVLLTKALRNNAPLKGNALKIFFTSTIYKMYLNIGVRIKAPKVIEPPTETLDVAQVKKDFAKTRAQLYEILGSVTPEQDNKFWVHHMYLKELRVADLLGFMIFHQNHHWKAIIRYLKEKSR
jgi:uncharacterized damage-inducible protein DinB